MFTSREGYAGHFALKILARLRFWWEGQLDEENNSIVVSGYTGKPLFVSEGTV